MSTASVRSVALLCAVAIVCGGLFVRGADGPRTALPDAAVAALKEAFPEATPGKVEKSSEYGVAFFDVEMKQGDKEFDVEVTADGILGEVESKIPLDEVPDAVLLAVAEAQDERVGDIVSVELHEIHGVVKGCGFAAFVKPVPIYELKVVSPEGKRSSVEVAFDSEGKGKIIHRRAGSGN